jgi:outer membrane protein assembly factor BamA
VEVSVETALHPTPAIADFELTIRPGDRVTVDEVQLVGASASRQAQLQAEVQVRAGQIYDESQVEQTQRRLEQIGTLERVVHATEPVLGHPGHAIIRFEVHERQPSHP